MLRAEEVELLVCGNPSLDINELRRVAVYDGYTADDDTIRLFSFCRFVSLFELTAETWLVGNEVSNS